MKNKLKLLLLSMMFIGLGLSFCSADTVSDLITFVKTGHIDYASSSASFHSVDLANIGTNYGTYCIKFSNLSNKIGTYVSLGFVSGPTSVPTNNYFLYFDQFNNFICLYGNKSFFKVGNRQINSNISTFLSGITFSADYEIFKLNTLLDESIITSCSPSSINVLYNNENSTSTVICNGDNLIEIDGLSTITATNKRTPYFNVNYRDEDNQLLTESYSKDILYLSGSLFKKTYTGNNDRILTIQSNNNGNTFTGYVPIFDVTGTTQPEDTDYNMFNNFADNSLKVLLSNIPGYIQYGFIFMFILLLLSLIKMFKRRK